MGWRSFRCQHSHKVFDCMPQDLNRWIQNLYLRRDRSILLDCNKPTTRDHCSTLQLILIHSLILFQFISWLMILSYILEHVHSTGPFISIYFWEPSIPHHHPLPCRQSESPLAAHKWLPFRFWCSYIYYLLINNRMYVCNEHGTIYAISSDFGDRMTTQSMGLMVLLSEHF